MLKIRDVLGSFGLFEIHAGPCFLSSEPCIMGLEFTAQRGNVNEGLGWLGLISITLGFFGG